MPALALAPPRLRRRLGEHDLQRRGDRAFQQVATTSRSVREPQHGVDVQARLASVPDRDIFDRAQDLALLLDGDHLVITTSELPADG